MVNVTPFCLLIASLIAFQPTASYGMTVPGDTLASVVQSDEEGDSTEADASGTSNAAQQDEEGPEVNVGGAVRFNATYRDYVDADRSRLGDVFFETFIINATASHNDLSAAVDYRFYDGYHMLKYGYVSYDFSDALTGTLGVHRVPFGPLPYVGNSWFFQASYYLGFEDDYDAGVKLAYQKGPWDVQAAFYKTEEGSYTGSSAESVRYSFDVVPTTTTTSAANGEARALVGSEEVNQGNLRVAYTHDHGTLGSTEFGLSGQLGGLYNATTDETGTHQAIGGHIDGTYGSVNIKLEALRYEHHPENPDQVEVDGQELEVSDRFITVGGFDFPYEVARNGNLYQASLSYRIPVAWGPVSSVTLYNDFAFLDKDVPGDDVVDAPQNITGVMLSTGSLYIYNDFVYAKNQPFAVPGSVYGRALGRGSDEWFTRFNINIGYYF